MIECEGCQKGVNSMALEHSRRNSLCSNMGDRKYPCVCRRRKLHGRGVHSTQSEK